MGQYYYPVSMEKREHVYSHSYGNGLKLMEHSWIGNNFVNAVSTLIAKGGAWFGDRIVWAGDYADKEKGRKLNLHSLCDKEVKPNQPKKDFRYFLNLDTMEFVDTKKIPLDSVYTDDKGKNWEYRIHPLPLLTCEGNGRGGGDYHLESPLVGKWARNRIIAQNTKPSQKFAELLFTLTEKSVNEKPVLV